MVSPLGSTYLKSKSTRILIIRPVGHPSVLFPGFEKWEKHNKGHYRAYNADLRALEIEINPRDPFRPGEAKFQVKPGMTYSTRDVAWFQATFSL